MGRAALDRRGCLGGAREVAGGLRAEDGAAPFAICSACWTLGWSCCRRRFNSASFGSDNGPGSATRSEVGRDGTPWAQPAEAAPKLDPSRRGEPMASVQEIRRRLRGQRIETLRSSIEPLLAGKVGAEVWLFGSLARGDWDARSDVDLLAVAPDQSAADQLAEALLGTGLADDVIGLSQGRWLERQRGDDPWWRGICRDAIRLQPQQTP